jgi:hypothetical protein
MSGGYDILKHHFITFPKILSVEAISHHIATAVKDVCTSIYSALMISTTGVKIVTKI